MSENNNKSTNRIRARSESDHAIFIFIWFLFWKSWQSTLIIFCCDCHHVNFANCPAFYWANMQVTFSSTYFFIFNTSRDIVKKKTYTLIFLLSYAYCPRISMCLYGISFLLPNCFNSDVGRRHDQHRAGVMVKIHQRIHHILHRIFCGAHDGLLWKFLWSLSP